MSLFKIFPILSIFLLLQACGFQTVYGNEQKQNVSELSRILIGPLPNRNGQILRNKLLTSLNTKIKNLKPIYSLNLKLYDSTSSFAISKKSFATRANLSIKSEFNLIRIKDNKILYFGKSESTVSYNILKNEYATIAVKKDAMARGLHEISKNIQGQLSVYFMRPQN
jgi:LPS-assembly lipoprotein